MPQIKIIDDVLNDVNQNNIISSDNDIDPDEFKIVKIIGRGATGTVKLVKRNEEYFAMKTIKKDVIIEKNLIDKIINERNILQHANHPMLISLK